MMRSDVDLAVQWAAEEGWNTGLADAECFWSTDPAGFYVGMLDDEPVTTISAVHYGRRFSFIGFYICRPAYRGRGYGLRTWQHAFAQNKADTIGLDGVVEQQANYARSGFTLAHRNIRFASDAPASADRQPEKVSVLGPGHLKAIKAFDLQCFGCERPAFLEAWIGAAGHRAIGVWDNGVLRGYGVVRPCLSGAKIGPLFADDADTAAILFDELAAASEARPLFLDVPEPNEAALALAHSRGMTAVFETVRMYRGEPWSLPLQRIFGITTFELG